MFSKGLFKLLILVGGILIFNSLGAQNLGKPKGNLLVEFTGDTVYYNIEDSSSTYFNDTVSLKLILSKSDSFPVSKIHLSLGDVPQSGNLLSMYFVVGGAAAQGGGTSYAETDNSIVIGLGEYYGFHKFYTQVWFEDSQGNLSGVKNLIMGR